MTYWGNIQANNILLLRQKSILSAIWRGFFFQADDRSVSEHDED